MIIQFDSYKYVYIAILPWFLVCVWLQTVTQTHVEICLAYSCQVGSPWMMRTTAAEHRCTWDAIMCTLYIGICGLFCGRFLLYWWDTHKVHPIHCIHTNKAWLCSVHVSVHGWGFILRRLPVNGHHALWCKCKSDVHQLQVIIWNMCTHAYWYVVKN